MRRTSSVKRMRELGWARVDPERRKLSAEWHHSSGWVLRHCGHPTANHPWALYTPFGMLVLTGVQGPKRDPALGTAWDTLQAAAEWVDQELRWSPSFRRRLARLGMRLQRGRLVAR